MRFTLSRNSSSKKRNVFASEENDLVCLRGADSARYGSILRETVLVILDLPLD